LADGPSTSREWVRGLSLRANTHPLLRKLGIVTFAELASGVFGFAAFIVVATALGPSTFGRVAYAAALVGWIQRIVTPGLYPYGLREVALRPEDVRRSVGDITLLGLIISGVTVVGVMIYAILVVPPGMDRTLIIVFAAMMPVAALNISWAFIGMSRAPVVSLLTLATNALYAGAVFLVIRRPEQAPLVPAFQLLQNLLIALALLYFARRYWSGWELGIDWLRWKGVLKGSIILGLSAIMTKAYNQMDILLLHYLRGDTEAGLYAAAYQLMSSAVLLPATFLGSAVLPSITRAIGRDLGEASRKAELYLKHFFVLAFPVAVGGLIVQRELIELILGANFVPAAPVFGVLTINLLVAGTAALFSGCILLGLQRNRAYLGVVVLGGVVNLGINLALIPHFGMIAAAYTTLAAQAAVALAAAWLARREVPVPWLRHMVKPLVGCGVMAGAIYAVRAVGGSIWIEVPVGALSYGVCVLGLRAVDTDFLLNRAQR
jgi:O-antigen/teichoic acid export membrane protein